MAIGDRVTGIGVEQVYLCARCMLPGDSPGPCPRCGQERLTCRPGDPDDPCRRPWIDAQGQVRTRAPLWWLKQTVGSLAETFRHSQAR
jgi:hypothetical protein